MLRYLYEEIDKGTVQGILVRQRSLQLPQISVRPSVCHAIEKRLQVDALERYASIKALMKDLYADPVYDEKKLSRKMIRRILRCRNLRFLTLLL